MATKHHPVAIVWEDDWTVGSHKEYFGPGSAYEDREPDTCEQATLYDEHGTVLASLGCIDDADDDYRKHIESELVDEAMAMIADQWAGIDKWFNLAPSAGLS